MGSLLGLALPAATQVLLSESFDNAVFPPAGWKNVRTAPFSSTTSDLWQRTSTGSNPTINPHSGAGMAFYNSYSYSSGTQTELSTPVLNFSTAGTDTVRFWMYRDGGYTSAPDLLDVFVNTAQGAAGGTLLATIHRSFQLSPATSATGWYRYTFLIPSGYSGATNYIIFRATSGYGNNIMIDDVEVTGPAIITCKVPTSFNTSMVGTNNVTVNWATPPGGSSGYMWELRNSGGAGSGAAGLVSAGSGTPASATITGLTANTAYNFYVRNICSGQDTGFWTAPAIVKTACDAFSIPFSENFDGVTAPALPNCFTIVNANGGNAWANTNLGASSFSAPSSPNAVAIASAMEAGNDDWLFTPALQLQAGVNYRLNFAYKSLFSSFSNRLEVHFGTAPQAQSMTSSAFYSNFNINNQSAMQALASFVVPTTGIYYLGFHNITPAGAYNFQMLLDNILIDIGPDPACGFPGNLAASDLGLNTALVRWTPPATGLPQTYSWELRTSGLPGSGPSGLFRSGTAANDVDSLRLNTLAMETKYSFYIRTNCPAPSYGNWSPALTFTTPTSNCNPVQLVNISNIHGSGFTAYWSPPALTSPHIGFDWEVRTSGTGGSGPTGLIKSGSTTDTFATTTGLSASTQYYFFLRSRCASGSNSTWTWRMSTTTIANDQCSGAIQLPIGNGFCTNPLTTRLDNATPTAGLPTSCARLTAGNTNSLKDVWFRLTIPATGNAIVETFTFSISVRDQMMIAYTGTCDNLTELACDRNGVPDEFTNYQSYQSRLVFTNRTPGETIWIRVLPDANPMTYDQFTEGEFGIGAWDTSAAVLPAVSPGGACISGLPVTISTANRNGYRWSPIFDATGRIIAEICPNDIVGTINTKVNVHAGSLRPVDSTLLLDRNFTFTSQSYTFGAHIRLYYTAAELDRLKAALPDFQLDSIRVVGTSNMVCSDTLSGTRTTYKPNSIGAYGADGYVEMHYRKLEQFFLYAERAPVVMYSGFEPVPDAHAVQLKWTTAKEVRIQRFTVERSADSLNFTAIGTVPSKVNGVQSYGTLAYAYTDAAPRNGIGYYRLKTEGYGTVFYSPILRAVYTPAKIVQVAVVDTLVRLNWKTDAEVENLEFVVERSQDSVQFTAIGSVPSAAANGNSAVTLFYLFNDPAPLVGRSWYRVKQVDRQGAHQYSEKRSVQYAQPYFVVDTLRVMGLTACTATFNALLDVSGSVDSVRFEYGIDGFTHTVESPDGYIVNNRDTAVATAVNLLQGTTYRVRTSVYFRGSWQQGGEEVQFTTAAMAQPVITTIGNAQLCTGDTVVLQSSASSGYQWYHNDTAIANARVQMHAVTQSGNYTVRNLVSGCLSAPAAGVQVTHTVTPARPDISGPASWYDCLDSTQTLTTPAVNGYAYQWQLNGVDLEGANAASLTAKTSGAYTVRVARGSCSAVSAPHTLQLNTKPPRPVITPAGSVSVCPGDTLTLTSSYAGSQQWSQNGIPIYGVSGNTLKVHQQGIYSVEAMIGSCLSDRSDSVVVTKATAPVAAISTLDATTFCMGDTALLQAQPAQGNTYQWGINGQAIAGATGASYAATVSGIYTVWVTRNGCTTSDDRELTVKPLPVQPSITAVGNVLTSSATTVNQWYLNGAVLPGATAQQYTVQASGAYTVQATQQGCTSLSGVYQFVGTGIAAPVAWRNEVTVFPNPAGPVLNLTNSGGRKLQVQLTDLLGKVIYEAPFSVSSMAIPLQGLAQGAYLLQISDLKKNESLKQLIIKQ